MVKLISWKAYLNFMLHSFPTHVFFILKIFSPMTSRYGANSPLANLGKSRIFVACLKNKTF